MVADIQTIIKVARVIQNFEKNAKTLLDEAMRMSPIKNSEINFNMLCKFNFISTEFKLYLSALK